MQLSLVMVERLNQVLLKVRQETMGKTPRLLVLLLQAVVEDSVGRGEAAGAAAVLFQAMAVAEEQARAGADE